MLAHRCSTAAAQVAVFKATLPRCNPGHQPWLCCTAGHVCLSDSSKAQALETASGPAPEHTFPRDCTLHNLPGPVSLTFLAQSHSQSVAERMPHTPRTHTLSTQNGRHAAMRTLILLTTTLTRQAHLYQPLPPARYQLSTSPALTPHHHHPWLVT